MNVNVRHKTMKWIWTIIASGAIGRVAAWFVWMAIYAPGSSVITDEQHVLYFDKVVSAGAIVGCVLGLSLKKVAKYPVLSTLLIHVVGFLIFLLLPLRSWSQGLVIYSAGIIMGSILTVALIMKLERNKMPNNSVDHYVSPAADGG